MHLLTFPLKFVILVYSKSFTPLIHPLQYVNIPIFTEGLKSRNKYNKTTFFVIFHF